MSDPGQRLAWRMIRDATSGHAYWAEGSEGRAVCECGATSPRVGTQARRQEWFRAHKVRAAEADQIKETEQ